MSRKVNWFYLLCCCITFEIFGAHPVVAAELVELPPEELARESVLPVFDKPVTVRNRLLVQEGRFEMGLYYGWAMSEPIFNVNKIGLSGYYHFAEDHALGLIYAKNSAGLTSYANQLHDQYALDFSRAPYPEYSLMADYNFNAYYGKISVTKKSVVNTMTLLTATAGATKYVHKTYPVLAVGFGEKFYLASNLSLRLDMRLHIHQGPVPFLKGRMADSEPIPGNGEFADRINYTTNLDVGLNYLF